MAIKRGTQKSIKEREQYFKSMRATESAPTLPQDEFEITEKGLGETITDESDTLAPSTGLSIHEKTELQDRPTPFSKKARKHLNKYLKYYITLIILPFIIYAIRVTIIKFPSFMAKTEEAVNNVKKDVGELKKDVGEIKKDIKNIDSEIFNKYDRLNEKIHQNELSIQKNTIKLENSKK